jgi:hypothetical protein
VNHLYKEKNYRSTLSLSNFSVSKPQKLTSALAVSAHERKCVQSSQCTSGRGWAESRRGKKRRKEILVQSDERIARLYTEYKTQRVEAKMGKIIVAFDLYGTLLSTESIAKELASHFGKEKAQSIAGVWRKYQLEYTWRFNSMSEFSFYDISTV